MKKITESFFNKEISGLDINKGLERYDSDKKIYLKLLRSYAVNVGAMLGDIENVSEETLANYKIKVHSIKGISLDIFAQKIGNDAKALEEAAKVNDFEFINKNNPIFIEAARKLVIDIEDMISSCMGKNI